MKRLVITALLALPLLAQQPPQPQVPQRTTKLIHLKYADPSAINHLVSQFGVNVVANSQMKVMTIDGMPDRLAAAEAAIQQLDVAPKNVELVVHLVVGSDQVLPNAAAVPAEIRDVISQLKGTFTFKEYRMLDVLIIRTRAGSSAESTGILDQRSNPPRLSMFTVRNTTVSEDGQTVRLDRMHAGIRIPIVNQGKTNYTDTGVDQDIDVKEGQKVVVGRSSLEGPSQALFVILTAKVL
jgi:hypothetical protein